MSIIDTGLGWYCDEAFLVNAAGTYLSKQSATFTKTNTGYAVAVYLKNSSNNYNPALVSTVADNVKFSPRNDGDVSNRTFTKFGLTWYYSTFNYANGTIDSNCTLQRYFVGASIADCAPDILDFAGVTTTPTYTVNFNSNSGTGTMNPQEIEVDAATPLSLNAFSKAGYDFVGWSTSPNGPVEYTDGESVTNLTEGFGSITLYAIWQAESLKIILQRNVSDSNHVDKAITNMVTLSGTLKQPTSLLNPVFLIGGILEYVATANYMTIPKFGNRSYYITEIRSVRNNLIEIHGKVDVLYTYRSILRQQTAIVHRQEKRYNLYLNDGVLKFYQNPHVVTQVFPSGFSGQNPNLLLIVAGGGGNPST